MVKSDFTNRALANKMKSVGLQKLRWYCQMCSKQCRDQNGFKCHTQSEGHLRQMRLFADNSGRILSDFSNEFMKGFMQILSRHGSKRILANRVYQEYIQDKNHIHMNATTWSTLTGLCMYLGKEGKAIVDETEKGWYVQYIDNDPEKAARQQAMEDRREADLNDAEENERMIQAQIEAAQRRLEEQGGGSDDEDAERKNELIRDEEASEPLTLGLKLNPSVTMALTAKKRLHSAFATNDDDDEEDTDKPKDKHATLGIKMPSFIPTSLNKSTGFNSGTSTGASSKSTSSSNAQPSSVPATSASSASSSSSHMVQSNAVNKSESSSSSSDRKDYWLYTDIVVKVVSSKLSGGKYYKQKGVVLKVRDRYVGEVELFDSGDIITVDQNDLQTVISDDSVGAKVLIVNGLGRGYVANIVKVFKDDCDIRINDRDAGSLDDKLLTRVCLDDVCSLRRRK